jgi:hypothetical protein
VPVASSTTTAPVTRQNYSKRYNNRMITIGSYDAVDSKYTPNPWSGRDADPYLYLIDPITKQAVRPYRPTQVPMLIPSTTSVVQPKRRPISIEVRETLAEDQDNRCYYCCRSLVGVAAHVDHKKPFSKGGNDSMENYCLACAKCNILKNANSVEHYAISILNGA